MKKTKITESKLKSIIKKAIAKQINEQYDPLDLENVKVGMIVQSKETGEDYKVAMVNHNLRAVVLLSLGEIDVDSLPDEVKKSIGPGFTAKHRIVAVMADDLPLEYTLSMNEQKAKNQHNEVSMRRINKYSKLFREKLKNMYGTLNLGDLSEPERKKFFSSIDLEWKSKKEKMSEQVLPMDDLAYDGYGYDEMEDLYFSDDEMDMLQPTYPDMPPLYDDDYLMNEDDDNISISDIRALHRDRSKGDIDAREKIRGFETEFIELMDKLIEKLSPSEIENVMRQIKRIPMVKRACEEEETVAEGKRRIRISDLDKIIQKYI